MAPPAAPATRRPVGVRRRRRPRLALVLAAALLLIPASASAPASAAEPARRAVVIGNAAYPARPLANPVNDARAVTAGLRDLGFEVTLIEDADAAELRRIVEGLPKHFARGDTALVYFAGHAVQHRGVNHLLPVDHRPVGVPELVQDGLTADAVLDGLHAAGVGVAILVLDACRDSPFGGPDAALGPGLAPVGRAPGETLVAYATAAGAVAHDGDGPNSPYTAALVSALERPGLTLEAVFRRVRAEVRAATDGRQLPWVSGSLESAIVLRPPAPATGGTAGAGAADGTTLDAVAWTTIRASADPGDFARFMALHPTSPLAARARERRAALLARRSASTPDPVVRVAEGAVAGATACDLAASDPFDPARLAAGRRAGAVNAPLALRLCAEALAADPGEPRLRFLLGRSLDAAGRHGEAHDLYRQAAEAGHAAAMVNLAFLLDRGRGVPPDPVEAARLLRRAALAGNPRARNELGRAYLAGRGVPTRPAEGFRWVALAAGFGWVNAIDHLGNLYRDGRGVARDSAQALALYRTAAERGSANAMNNLARMLLAGVGGPADVPAALMWFERATAAGNAFAPRHLGVLYRDGRGVARDPGRALALFALAAERGFVEAHADLGAMYEAGIGGPADAEAAFVEYRLVSEAGRRRGGAFARAAAEAGIGRLAARLDADARARAERRVAKRLARTGPVPVNDL